MNNFTYSTIPTDRIRLLKLVTRSQRLLEFSVSVVKRVNAPPYTAISYAWGDDEPTQTIFLNGRPFKVRPNLWSCLYHIGYRAYGQGLCVWADAICINQDDDGERSAQVRCMNKIYANAFMVSVWLGPVGLQSDPESSVLTTNENKIGWKAQCLDLANRTYWTRYWVIQEFLLAKKIELFCGEDRLKWSLIRDRVWGEIMLQDNGPTPKQMYQGNRMLPFIRPRHLSRPADSLYNLLITHCDSQCKDPRDRVFALLGIVEDGEQRVLGRFFPDYSLSRYAVVVIALAHIMHYSPTAIPISERLFVSLAITSRIQEENFVRYARGLKYPGTGPGHRLVKEVESLVSQTRADSSGSSKLVATGTSTNV